MQKIYKISNRKLKKPNPKNDTTIEKQYREEKKKIDRKRQHLDDLNNFRTKLYIGDKNQKRQALKGFQNETKNLRNQREIRNQMAKHNERRLEIKNIEYHKKLEEKLKKQFVNKKKKFRQMNLQNIDLMRENKNNQYQSKVKEIAKDKRVLDYNNRHYKRNFL